MSNRIGTGMKLTIDRSELIRGLGHVTSVVEKRTTIPILSNVLLKATGEGLALRATDLEREVTEMARADVHQPGAITVPAHTLYDIARKLPDGAQVEMRIDHEKGRLVVASGRSRFTLQVLAPEDYPDLSPGELSHRFELTAGDLKRLIEAVRFAISTEETRYYLNGIYLHVAQQGSERVLRGVSTDGHRLARADYPLPEGADGMPGIILPRKTVAELHRLLEVGDARVAVGLSSSKARFEIGAVSLTTKLIDGTFPDYDRVIPKDGDKVLKVSRAVLASAVERVAIISSERGKAVACALSGGSLVLSANDQDGGSATEEIAADYTGSELTIGFNHKYVLDILGALNAANVEVTLKDPGSPIIARNEGSEAVLYVLMPMRV